METVDLVKWVAVFEPGGAASVFGLVNAGGENIAWTGRPQADGERAATFLDVRDVRAFAQAHGLEVRDHEQLRGEIEAICQRLPIGSVYELLEPLIAPGEAPPDDEHARCWLSDLSYDDADPQASRSHLQVLQQEEARTQKARSA